MPVSTALSGTRRAARGGSPNGALSRNVFALVAGYLVARASTVEGLGRFRPHFEVNTEAESFRTHEWE
jgi:hypothetical protein